MYNLKHWLPILIVWIIVKKLSLCDVGQNTEFPKSVSWRDVLCRSRHWNSAINSEYFPDTLMPVPALSRPPLACSRLSELSSGDATDFHDLPERARIYRLPVHTWPNHHIFLFWYWRTVGWPAAFPWRPVHCCLKSAVAVFIQEYCQQWRSQHLLECA